MTRTGSIGSCVGPAVTRMCLPLRSSLAAQLRGRGTAEGGGGGYSADTDHCSNMPKNAFEIFQNVIGGDSQCPDALALEPLITKIILFWPVSSAMRFAVDFNRKAGGGTKEIENIGAGRVLTTILNAVRFLAKFAPKQDLRKAHRATKTSRPALIAFDPHPPPPCCARSPSPAAALRGRN